VQLAFDAAEKTRFFKSTVNTVKLIFYVGLPAVSQPAKQHKKQPRSVVIAKHA